MMTRDEGNLSVIIDIEALENFLKSESIEIEYSFDDVAIASNNFNSIHKIRKCIGENVYEPSCVSIGPYHHGKQKLHAMNERKWSSMQYILRHNNNKKLPDYIKALRKVEHIVRNYYNEEIKMESDEFLNMLLLDGCFILVSTYAVDQFTHEYQDLGDFQQHFFVAQDLFLVENQIPFLVLKIIYELFNSEENTSSSLSNKIAQFVEQILCHYPKAIKETSRPRYFHYLLHLCHMYLRPNRNNDSSKVYQGCQNTIFWRNAVQYHNAGVKFTKTEFEENNPHSLLDVRFTNNMLEIPHLRIDENTPSLLQNLTALEQTTHKLGNDITAYIIFMSQLIQNTKDVALLVSKGIIEHDLRSEEEVVDLFMKISEGIAFDYRGSFYLKNICHNLEEYYQTRMKRWNVWIRRSIFAIFDRISEYV